MNPWITHLLMDDYHIHHAYGWLPHPSFKSLNASLNAPIVSRGMTMKQNSSLNAPTFYGGIIHPFFKDGEVIPCPLYGLISIHLSNTPKYYQIEQKYTTSITCVELSLRRKLYIRKALDKSVIEIFQLRNNETFAQSLISAQCMKWP